MLKIVAEAGCNWKNLDEARLFVDKSKELNLWATKFQVYNEDNIKGNPNEKFLKSIMIDKDIAGHLFRYGRQIGQRVFFTPMYQEAVDWLEEIGVEYYKIRYADRWNYDLVNRVMNTSKKTFISMCYEDSEYSWALNHPNILKLFCVPNYPAKRKSYYKDFLYGFDGISDHTKGTKLIKQSIKFGFDYHEKHIKLDNDCLESKWSVSFEELAEVLGK